MLDLAWHSLLHSLRVCGRGKNKDSCHDFWMNVMMTAVETQYDGQDDGNDEKRFEV